MGHDAFQRFENAAVLGQPVTKFVICANECHSTGKRKTKNFWLVTSRISAMAFYPIILVAYMLGYVLNVNMMELLIEISLN